MVQELADETFNQLGLFEDEGGAPEYPGTTTVSGRFDGTAGSVNVNDIAHALSFECRYGGHSERRLNVAQHSLIVAALSKDPLEGLLHDAHEAYIKDVPKPLKMVLPDYNRLEDHVAAVVREHFEVAPKVSKETKFADLLTMFWEAYWIVKGRAEGWRGRDKYLQPWMEASPLKILSDEHSEALFKTTYHVLSQRKGGDSFIKNTLRPELGIPKDVDIYAEA